MQGWQPTTTLPDSDDLVWLCHSASRSIEGPRPPHQEDVDSFDLWAPCVAPPLPARKGY